jgi:hypothetical protein
LLADFHARHAGPPPTITSLDRLIAELTELLQGIVAARRGSQLQLAMTELDRRHIESWLPGYLQQWQSHVERMQEIEQPLQPTYYEVSFGESHPSALQDLTTPVDGTQAASPPLILQTPAGQVRLAGRIDRIDVGRHGERVLLGVVDYKTGKTARGFSLEGLETGRQLQVAVYMLAAETVLLADANPLPWYADYWRIRQNGLGSKKEAGVMLGRIEGGAAIASEEGARLADGVCETVGRLVNGIRHGEFPMTGNEQDSCRYCDYRRICRVAQARSLEKRIPAASDEQ